MKLEKKHWVIIGVIVAIIVIWYFYFKKKKTESNFSAVKSRVAPVTVVSGPGTSDRPCPDGMYFSSPAGKCVAPTL